MTLSRPARSRDLLSAAESLLLVVDVQDRLWPQVATKEAVAANCGRLLRAAELFGVPALISEQYPKGLGATVPALTAVAAGVPKVEKLRFSAAEATGWPASGERDDPRHLAVLAGIETHICILQTAFDLLALGYRVFVVADAVGSRKPLDHETALRRLRDGGVTVVTTESVLFEWCEAAGTEPFKAIRDLVKEG